MAETEWIAPAGVMTGRVDHHNRFGGQWRIACEEVKIRERRAGEGRRESVLLDAVAVEGPLQILAYDDKL